MQFLKKTSPRTMLIDIPQPCDADWEQMQPVACGRFCGQCQKNLIDFTLLSDAQLGALLGRKDGNICGRFSAEQLNRPIILPETPQESTWQSAKRMAAAALLLLPSLTATTASAQQDQGRKAGTTQSDPATAPLQTITISGRITDLATGDSLQGLEVVIDNDHKTYSNGNGFYSFTLPASYAGRELTVSVPDQPGNTSGTSGTIILGERVQTDSLQQHYTVDLHRYPLLSTKKIDIQGVQELQYTGLISVTQYATRPAKAGPWKRFKAIFKKKKS